MKPRKPTLAVKTLAAALVAPLAIPLIVALLSVAIVVRGASLDLSSPTEYVLMNAVLSAVITYPASLLFGLPILLMLNRLNKLTTLNCLIAATVIGIGAPLLIAAYLQASKPNPQFTLGGGFFLILGPPTSLIVTTVFCLLARLPWRTPKPVETAARHQTPLILTD